MSVVLSICEEIQNKLNKQCFCVHDIKLAQSAFDQKKYFLPAVIISESAITVFVQVNCCYTEDNKLKIELRRVLNILVERLDVSVNSFMLYAYSPANEETNTRAGLYSFNIYNERINYFPCNDQADEFVSSVINDLTYRCSIFDEDVMSCLSFNLEVLGASDGKIKRDPDGNYFIKKHGQWREASDCDADEMFNNAALWGAFGAHKFYEHKRGAGLLYCLTGGLFGVGWLLDCLALLLGIYKDAYGRYLLPVSDVKACLVKMAGGLLITAGYIAGYIALLHLLGNSLNSILDNTINSNGDLLSGVADN